jgi:hypothetical protein
LKSILMLRHIDAPSTPADIPCEIPRFLNVSFACKIGNAK